LTQSLLCPDSPPHSLRLRDARCLSLPGPSALFLVFHKGVWKRVGAPIFQKTEEIPNLRRAPRAADVKALLPVRSLEVDKTRSPFHDQGFAPRHGQDFLRGVISRTASCSQLRRILFGLRSRRFCCSAPGRPFEAATARTTSFGSGAFITDDGYFLTCHHVIAGASRIGLRVGSREIPATLTWSDPHDDVALLKASGWFAAMPLVASSSVRMGDSVFTIGFPNPQLQGVSPKLTRGEISALAGTQDDPRLFQISLPVQPGNSGGPLVDARGNLVGMVAARLNDAKLLNSTGS
jgi:S1-C subfamily serine protease